MSASASDAAASPPPATHMSLPHRVTFSAPAFALGALAVALTVYLPKYFGGYIGIGAAAVAASFGLVRFIDIPLDPIIGLLMDRTRVRLGRYRLWMCAGAPVFMAAVYMAFFAHKGAGPAYLIVWALAVYLGVSLLTLPHLSWAAQLAPTYRQRSALFGLISLVGVAGAGAILLLPSIMGGKGASEVAVLHAMGLFMIVAAPVGVILALIGTRESETREIHGESAGLIDYWRLFVRPEVLRLLAADLCLAMGPQWMSALYLYFFHESRHFTLAVASALLALYIFAGLAGAPILGWLAGRFGKHKVLMGACVGYSLGLTLLFVMPKGNVFIDGPFMAFMGFLAVGFVLLVRAMMGDVADKVRLETGKNRVGLLYSLITSTQKLGGALAIVVTFGLLPVVGYNITPDAHNTAAAIHGLELTYLIGPIAFVMLGAVSLIGYRLDADSHARIRTQLEARDGLVPEAPILEGVTGDSGLPTSLPIVN